MAGHRNFDELRAKLDARPDANARRDRAAADVRKEIVAHERTLAALRRARELTQVQLAKTLGVNQAQVSRLERQNDLFLSTLASYVEAMGGELELVASFDDTGERVRVVLDDVTRDVEPEEADPV